MNTISIILFIFICIAVILAWFLVYDSSRFVIREYRIPAESIGSSAVPNSSNNILKENVPQPDAAKTDALDGCLRIAFLSDLHCREYDKGNVRLLRAIKAQAPDLILMGGDMMVGRPKAKFDQAVSFINGCCEIAPVYYAVGNHEYRTRIYPDTYGSLYTDYMEALRPLTESGKLCFLDNASVRLSLRDIFKERNIINNDDLTHTIADELSYMEGENIDAAQTNDAAFVVISGLTIDREYYRRFHKKEMPEGYLKSLLSDGDQWHLASPLPMISDGDEKTFCVNCIRTSPGDESKEGAVEDMQQNGTEHAFHILLAHNPDYFRAYAEQLKPDLVLSGHVHGGVARIPFWKGVIAPTLRLFPHYDGGEFQEFGSRMILSRGLGMHTIPLRLFNPAEVVIVQLEKKTISD